MQNLRAPLLMDKQLYRLVHYAVDLTITGPSAYIDLRELQSGTLAFHMIITDQVLMNFYRSRPEEAKPLLIKYARHLAMEYLKQHQEWFNLQLNEDTIIVRMAELKDNTQQFQVMQ
jgi:hypothetical protein